MATVTRSAGTFTEGNLWGVGSYHWVDGDNMLLSDGSYATVLRTGAGYYPYTALLTNFGFTIPVGSIIQKITAKIEGKSNNTGLNRIDWVILLLPSGGTSLMQAMGSYDSDCDPDQPLTASDQVISFNPVFLGDGNLWGNAWTPAIVNDADFGVGFDCYLSDRTQEILIDHVQITIEYIEGEPVTDVCSTLQCGKGFENIEDAIKSIIAKYTTGRGELDGCIGLKLSLNIKSCLDLTDLSECGTKYTLEEAFKAALKDDGCGNPVLNTFILPVINIQVL